MNTSFKCATVLSAVFAATLSPSALADLPTDVSELTRTQTLLTVGGAVFINTPDDDHMLGFSDSHMSEPYGAPANLSLYRTDSLSFADGSYGVGDHAIDADGVHATLNSTMRFGHWDCDLATSAYANYSMSMWYRLRTTGTQRITLTIEITGTEWPGYSLGNWEMDGLRPNPERTEIDQVGLLVREHGSSGWYMVPTEVVLPGDFHRGDRVYKVQCRVGLPAGDYELMIRSRSARYSTDQCEPLDHLTELTRVSLDFEASDSIPAGLSMFSQGDARVRAEIRDDEEGVLIDWSSSVVRGAPALAEEGATSSYAMGVFDHYTRTEDSYNYTFFSEAGVGSLFDSPSGDGVERTLEINAEASFQFTADESMRLSMHFPSWLDSDWDSRTFGVEVVDLETGEIVEPMRAWDHGRQYTYQIAPGTYEFIHVLSMDRRLESSGQSVSLDWKDDIDARVVFRILGDTNGDGRVDGQDLSMLLGGWGQEDPTLSLDSHDVIDGRDLSILLGSWRP